MQVNRNFLRKQIIGIVIGLIFIQNIFIFINFGNGVDNIKDISLNSEKLYSDIQKIDTFCDPELLKLELEPENQNLHISVIIIIQPEMYDSILNQLENNENFSVKSYYQQFNLLEVNGPLNECLKLRNLQGINGIYLNDQKRVNEFTLQNEKEINSQPESASAVTLTTLLNLINMNNIQTRLSLNRTADGKGAVVAILDSGIDFTGQIGKDLDDLDDNLLTTDLKPIGTVSMVPYEPFYYSDFRGSGTFHAGIAVGTGSSNSSHKGIAPKANLLNIKVVDSVGLTYYSFVISGLQWALTHDVDVVCLPWVFPGYAYDPISVAINALVDEGVIVVVPVGDDGPAYTTIYSPGQSLKAISVGAYDHLTKQVANFSSRGPNYDLRVGPDVVAPGVNIIGPKIQLVPDTDVLMPFGLMFQRELMDGLIQMQDMIVKNLPQFGEPIPGTQSYTMISSTTAAAAIVAGVCAVIIGLFPMATPELIKLSLMKSAQAITGDVNLEGAGLINVVGAVSYLANILTLNYSIGQRVPQLSTYPGVIASVDYHQYTNSPYQPAEWDNYDVVALFSSQAMMTGLTIFNSSGYGSDQTNVSVSNMDLHTPLNQFAIRFNSSTYLFSELQVIRELANTTPYRDFRRNFDINGPLNDRSDYCRFAGVLGWNNELFITVIVESWSYSYAGYAGEFTNYMSRIPAFKFTFNFFTTSNSIFNNLTLYSFFKADLYLNEYQGSNSAYQNSVLDDEFIFDPTTQKCIVVDNFTIGPNATNEYTAMAFNSTSHSLKEYEIGKSVDLLQELMSSKPQFKNTVVSKANEGTQSMDEDIGFIQSWIITPQLNRSNSVNFNGIFGVGKGNSSQNAISRLEKGFHSIVKPYIAVQNPTGVKNVIIRDLGIVTIQTPRMHRLNTEMTTSVIFYNFGNTELKNTQISYLCNFTSRNSGYEVTSYFENILSLKPLSYTTFEYKWVPSKEGIYIAAWVIGNILDLQSNVNEDNFYNNYQGRALFIYSYNRLLESDRSKLFLSSPTHFPNDPLSLNYPGDIAPFNISLFTPLTIGRVQIKLSGTAAKSLIICSNNTIKKGDHYTILNGTIMVPLFFRAGTYSLNIEVRFIDWNRSINIPIQFTLKEPQGRLFFDGIHNQLIPSISNLDSIMNLNFNIFDQGTSKILPSIYGNLLRDRLDMPFGNYFSLKKTLSSIQPYGMSTIYLPRGLNSTSLMGALGDNQNIMGGLGFGNTQTTNTTSTTSNNTSTNLTTNATKTSSDRTSLAFSSLFPGDNFFRFDDEITTNAYTYDLIKFFDAVIFTQMDTSLSSQELGNLSRYLNLGGVIYVFCDSSSTTIINNTRPLLQLGGFDFNGTVQGKIKLSVDTSLPSELGSQLTELELIDPMRIKLDTENLLNTTTLLNPYMGYAQIGLGKIIIIGDGEILKESYLQNVSQLSRDSQNAQFIKNLFKTYLDVKLNFNITVSKQKIMRGESTYIGLELLNTELTPYIQRDFLAVMGIIDKEGNTVSAKLYGFSLPVMPILQTSEKTFYTYFDSNWYKNASDFTLVLILDTPYTISQIFTIEIKIDGKLTNEKVVLFKIPPAEYPYQYDVVFISLLLISFTVIWAYSNYKWRSRHRFIPMTEMNKNKINTALSSVEIGVKQILTGVTNSNLSDLEKIQYLLKTEKDYERLMKIIQNIASEMGEK
jgi:hypothetical protein